MKTALVAAIALFASVTTASALSYVDGTVVSVDEKNRTITLADRTIMEMPPFLDGTKMPVGQKLRIFAEIDEDGFEPITKIELLNQ
jgi:hypothetical protein